MKFAAPSFLFALTLLAIPIIIHLFNFYKPKKIRFTNVKLLQQLQQENKKVKQLKSWLLLALRCLALAALVLAFAEPYLPLSQDQNLSNQQQIYIDNSPSMGIDGLSGNFIKAKNLASDFIQKQSPNTRYNLANNQQIFRDLSQAEAIELIQNQDLSAYQASWHPVNRLSKFSKDPIVCFSDFQANNFLAEALAVDSNHLNIIKLQQVAEANVSIDSLALESPSVRVKTPFNLTLYLSNHGSEDVNSLPINLDIDGQSRAPLSISIPANQQEKITFPLILNNQGSHALKFSISDLPIDYDNELFAIITPRNRSAVTSLGNNPYLKQLFSLDQAFSYESMTLGNFLLNPPAEEGLIIIEYNPNWDAASSRNLISKIEEGATAFLALGSDVDKEKFNAAFQKTGIELSSSSENVSVSTLEKDAKFFEALFDKVPEKIDSWQLNHLWNTKVPANAKILATASNNQPVLIELTLGQGKVFIYPSGLNTTDGNWVKHGLFAPILLRASEYAGIQQDLYIQLNKASDFKIPYSGDQELNQVFLRQENQELLPSFRQNSGFIHLYLDKLPLKPGFYELASKDSTLGKIAVNNGLQESKISFLDEDELGEQLQNRGINFEINSVTDSERSIAGIAEGNKNLWPYFVVAALFFLLIELIWIRWKA